MVVGHKSLSLLKNIFRLHYLNNNRCGNFPHMQLKQTSLFSHLSFSCYRVLPELRGSYPTPSYGGSKKKKKKEQKKAI
jgi:hypothetical protein